MMRRYLPPSLLALVVLAPACSKVPNPYHDGADEVGGDTTGGDASGTGTATDVGGETGTSGDTGGTDTSAETTTGGCPVGADGCPCPPNKNCDAGLTCVGDVCVAEGGCTEVEDASISYTLEWVDGAAPVDPATTTCTLTGTGQANLYVLDFDACEAAVAGLQIELRPDQFPQNIPAIPVEVTAFEGDAGVFVRAVFDTRSLYLVDAEVLEAEGVTDYPWAIEIPPSSCPAQTLDCGERRRIGISVDGESFFDQSAGAFANGLAWVDTAVRECEVDDFLFVLIGDG